MIKDISALHKTPHLVLRLTDIIKLNIMKYITHKNTFRNLNQQPLFSESESKDQAIKPKPP